jgi:hypothetical protein
MTFDATHPSGTDFLNDSAAYDGLSVCSLGGAERFLVWALRWESSLHDDPAFARECLQESFERAGMADALPVFSMFVSAVHGERSPCSAASRLGCWKINGFEATTLHAVACLQEGHFGESWRALSSLTPTKGAAVAMLALGEVAEALQRVGGRIRRWPGISQSAGAAPQDVEHARARVARVDQQHQGVAGSGPLERVQRGIDL